VQPGLFLTRRTAATKFACDASFLLAGKLVELVRVRDTTAYVRRAKGRPDAVPRWMGGRMPLSTQLSEAVRRKLEQALHGQFAGAAMEAMEPLLTLQARWSRWPAEDELLIERRKMQLQLERAAGPRSDEKSGRLAPRVETPARVASRPH
jgi:Lhr-like helicase